MKLNRFVLLVACALTLAGMRVAAAGYNPPLGIKVPGCKAVGPVEFVSPYDKYAVVCPRDGGDYRFCCKVGYKLTCVDTSPGNKGCYKSHSCDSKCEDGEKCDYGECVCKQRHDYPKP